MSVDRETWQLINMLLCVLDWKQNKTKTNPKVQAEVRILLWLLLPGAWSLQAETQGWLQAVRWQNTSEIGKNFTLYD